MPEDPALTDRDLERIVERALELDAGRASRLTLAQVRQICAELDIQPESVEQAFAEHVLSAPARRALDVVEAAGLRAIKRRLRISAVAFGLSAAAIALWHATTSTFSEELLPWFFGVAGVVIPLILAPSIRTSDRARDTDEPAGGE